MTLPPFHPKAEEEMNAEADYYAEKHEDLGSDFRSTAHYIGKLVERSKYPL